MKKAKLMLGILAVIVVFFIVTFSKNWGTASSGAVITKYTPVVKQLQNNFVEARRKCPSIVAKLNKGLPELQQSGAKDKELLTYKLIADCQFARHYFTDAAEAYKKIAFAEPQVARWRGLVAESYYQAGNFGDALPVSILSTQLAPDDFKLKLLNARILRRLGLFNRAIEAYHQAIAIAPYQALEKTKEELNQLPVWGENIKAGD